MKSLNNPRKSQYLFFDKMRLIQFPCLLIAFFLALAVSSCTPAPNVPGTCASKTSSSNIFGVPEAKRAAAAAALHIRGGDLHEPETLADVEALVLNAATNNQLVVIDFTASWSVRTEVHATFVESLLRLFVFLTSTVYFDCNIRCGPCKAIGKQSGLNAFL
jgi:hypothetical protein